MHFGNKLFEFKKYYISKLKENLSNFININLNQIVYPGSSIEVTKILISPPIITG